MVVFAVGGGSYYEYNQMRKLETEFKEAAKGGSHPQIIYGADYIFSPEEFLQELNKVAK